jgi:pyruvate dehydrogenase E1 component beta subunit
VERVIDYGEAIREATEQEMARDGAVIVLGMGVDDPTAIYETTRGLKERFGPERVFDTPLSEDGMTGVAIGAALGGLRPIHVHIRMDFLLLAMNQLINSAAKMRYMYGGAVSVPLVVRAIIGRSWGQGAQHSQALHSMFMHVPGLRVVAPTTPYDAKGCLIQAIRDDNPVLFIEHRLLHRRRAPVPAEPYVIPFGRARLLAEGPDITLAGVSYASIECLRARALLEAVGIRAEVIDLLSLSPLDDETILTSVLKTRRLLVVDNAWPTCGAAAEVIARVLERRGGAADLSLHRMGFAPVTCPMTRTLEEAFYPTARTIAARAYSIVHRYQKSWEPDAQTAAPEILEFKGPF